MASVTEPSSSVGSSNVPSALGRYGSVVPVLFVLVCGALLTGLLAYASFYLETCVYQPVGSISEDAANSAMWSALFLVLALMLVYFAARIVVPICLLAIPLTFLITSKKRTRRIVVTSLVCTALLFVEAGTAFRVERLMVYRAFHDAFSQTALDAQPTIDAINAYEDAYGEYPANLESLVPEFLSEVPDTGLAGYPEFEYSVSDGETIFEDYQLLINTPSGGLNWDVFVYWPEGNYPDYFYGGNPELFGRWAYVHE